MAKGSRYSYTYKREAVAKLERQLVREEQIKVFKKAISIVSQRDKIDLT